jgi:hypothetical protein
MAFVNKQLHSVYVRVKVWGKQFKSVINFISLIHALLAQSKIACALDGDLVQ